MPFQLGVGLKLPLNGELAVLQQRHRQFFNKMSMMRLACSRATARSHPCQRYQQLVQQRTHLRMQVMHLLPVGGRHGAAQVGIFEQPGCGDARHVFTEQRSQVVIDRRMGRVLKAGVVLVLDALPEQLKLLQNWA